MLMAIEGSAHESCPQTLDDAKYGASMSSILSALRGPQQELACFHSVTHAENVQRPTERTTLGGVGVCRVTTGPPGEPLPSDRGILCTTHLVCQRYLVVVVRMVEVSDDQLPI